jgi:phosphoenolpyruvate-protein kinase (PTS system EI component)
VVTLLLFNQWAHHGRRFSFISRSSCSREYSLPLISNLPFATQNIKTGDHLFMDGNTGEVRILDEVEIKETSEKAVS